MVLRGEEVPPEKQKGAWDSNVITPGTEFMLNLSNFVQTYVRARISESSHYWKGIKIIFSDASIPGEGEHKIMSHVSSPPPSRQPSAALPRRALCSLIQRDESTNSALRAGQSRQLARD